MDRRGHNEDFELIRDCLAGSQQAWNRFYCRFVGLVRNVVYRKAGFLGQDLEDVVQEAFLALTKALKGYDCSYPLRSLVSAVADHVCADELRRRLAGKRRGETVPIEHHDDGGEHATVIASHDNRPDSQVSRAERVELLRRAFRRLSRDCRKLLHFRFVEGLEYKEFSEQFGLKTASLRPMVQRCLKVLRAEFDELARKGLRR